MLYRRSPPSPPRRLLQVVALSGAATILGFSACLPGGELVSTEDAGDDQGSSSGSGYSGSNGGSGGYSGSSGAGYSGSNGGSGGYFGSSSGSGSGYSGGQMLLDAAADGTVAVAVDAAAEADASPQDGGAE